MEGTVKKWIEDKGFGFIIGSDNKEYFCHRSQLPENTKSLMVDQKVSFEPKEGDKGPVANKVKLEV